MGTMTEDQTSSSKNGSNSNQIWTMYNLYQAGLSSQSQEKSIKGKPSSKKDKKQDGAAAGAAPLAAADPDWDANQNDFGVESLPPMLH
ncbi:hypothetical protein F3Y22_tig00110156pilonHSYRG00008 [Hibiscus syriacus]|uniref:Uncharacterized protein n=1 Tax=Hibiscus syriacus TaxID=106335 RepID=A0A6A3BFM8_HIBSY|nr:hypothetical protein F3Y22_tig00110156pilonHSYRG00008 [Hibiscus syriacus]